MGILNPVQGGNPRLCPMSQFHIPPDLVVAQGVSEGESSSHRDVLFLPDV
jgi:hypothetical protein